jgi:molybdate transport system substrate-binding protein
VAAAQQPAPKPSGSIRVWAAASLTDAFTRLKTEFRRANPGTNISLNFGSSATLVTQIQAGAPADVFVSADLSNMDKLIVAGKVRGSLTIFARNQMEIIVKPGNPQKVRTLADLKGLKTVALCGETVPCGIYAGAVLSR